MVQVLSDLRNTPNSQHKTTRPPGWDGAASSVIAQEVFAHFAHGVSEQHGARLEQDGTPVNDTRTLPVLCPIRNFGFAARRKPINALQVGAFEPPVNIAVKEVSRTRLREFLRHS